MAIDKIEWHSGADNFPANLPYENGGNHIGYFMEYLYKHNFIPDHSNGECDIEEYLKVKNGEISGLKFLIENCCNLTEYLTKWTHQQETARDVVGNDGKHREIKGCGDFHREKTKHH